MYGKKKRVMLSSIKEDKVRITLRLPKETYKKIRSVGERLKESEQKIIEAIIEQYLAK